jgi:hypothetical protein
VYSAARLQTCCFQQPSAARAFRTVKSELPGAPERWIASAAGRAKAAPVPAIEQPEQPAFPGRRDRVEASGELAYPASYSRLVTKVYTRAEADEILRRALAEEAEGGISHEDLVAAAREVGIPESAIEAAAERLGDHVEIERRVSLLRARKRRAWSRHLISFVIINLGIVAVDWLDGGGWFFQFPLVVWGVVLMLFGVMQLSPNPEALAKRAERELEKEQRRARWQQRRLPKGERQPWATSKSAKEFEAAVEQGVSALLSAAARAIQGVAGPRVRVDAGDEAESTEQQRRGRAPRARTPF